VLLLASPKLIARGAKAAVVRPLAVRMGCGLLVLIGLWLTHVG